MGGLFSKGKSKPQASRVSEQDRAILQLKGQRDKLKQYQKRLELQLDKDRDVARQLLASGKREKAKLLLRKKKYLESLLSKTDIQLDNLGQMVHDLEFAQIEVEVVSKLKMGNESLKRINELISLESVEQLMEETAEAAQYQRQISDLLSSAGSLSSQDEEDVLAELDALCSVDAEKPIGLPSVPSEEPEPATAADEAASHHEAAASRVRGGAKKEAVLAL